MIIRILFIALLLTGLCLDTGMAQSSFEERRAEIREQQNNARSEIESLEEQIETYQNRLQLASQRFDEMYRQYEELTRLITLQDERIRRMEQEQQQISREITLIEENLISLEQDLEALVEQYQSTLSYIYKHGRTTEIALVLTSSSINQLLIRSYYLSRFDQYRQGQEKEIRDKQEEYKYTREELDSTRQRNERSLADIQVQKQELAQKEEQQKRNIELLQRDRNNLQDQLSRVEQERRQLDEILTSLVEEEEELQRAEAERQRQLAAAQQIEDEDEREAAIARFSRPVARSLAVSEEELEAFEAEFRDSQGQLPWPVENGTITERFGERIHPVFRTRTNSLGIDIAAPAQSQIQVVNDGYVLRVQPVTSYGDMVIVSHGRYLTVYGNLSDVYVTRGNVLRRGDVIGLSGDENSIRGEVLFFAIRDGTETINPESWIQRPTP